MTKEQIEELLAKFIAGDISADEKTELEKWLSSEERHSLFRYVEREEWIKKGITELEKIDIDAGYKKYLQRISDAGQTDEATDENNYFIENRGNSRIRIALAVAALIILSLGSWWFFFREKESLPVAETPANLYKNEVEPGNNTAILQLADGSTISLDQSANGILANEGDATIQKTGADKLVYNSSATTESGGKPLFNTISTPAGGEYHVVLPDGSEVWLNASSSIRFPLSFSGNERRVTISGEVYFDVKEMKRNGKKLPFNVSINSLQKGPSGEVQVLGTRFTINAYDDEPKVKTTLLKGSVKVLPGKEKDGKVIRPGQQAGYTSNGSIDIQSVDTTIATAWKNDKFIFKNEPIQSIMRQMARWYNVKVIFKDELDAKFIAIFPRNMLLSELLQKLEKTELVRFAIDGKTVTVMR